MTTLGVAQEVARGSERARLSVRRYVFEQNKIQVRTLGQQDANEEKKKGTAGTT
jgi:hypothetical protein